MGSQAPPALAATRHRTYLYLAVRERVMHPHARSSNPYGVASRGAREVWHGRDRAREVAHDTALACKAVRVALVVRHDSRLGVDGHGVLVTVRACILTRDQATPLGLHPGAHEDAGVIAHGRVMRRDAGQAWGRSPRRWGSAAARTLAGVGRACQAWIQAQARACAASR